MYAVRTARIAVPRTTLPALADSMFSGHGLEAMKLEIQRGPHEFVTLRPCCVSLMLQWTTMRMEGVREMTPRCKAALMLMRVARLPA